MSAPTPGLEPPVAPPPAHVQPPRGRRPRGLVLGLAASDSRNEWILTLCLILAIAAVLSPLLLLFGLKYGTIETLRRRLIEDPRNREIRPMVSTTFAREWFDTWRGRSDVAFLVPLTRQIAATVSATVKDASTRVDLDLIPSAAGDPLLKENGCPAPADGEAVVTRFAAEALGAKPGDTLVVTATRIKGSQYEKGEISLKVAGVLPVSAGATRAIYSTLPLLENVERFKDGQAVPEYGWKGAVASAYPVYNGLVIALPAPLDKVEEYQLCNNTGFTRIERLDPAALSARAGIGLATNRTAYLLASARRPVGEDSVVSVRNRLRGRQAVLMPWVEPIPARLVFDGAAAPAALHLAALSSDTASATAAELSPVPPWADKARLADGTIPILLPEGLQIPTNAVCRLSVTNADQVLEFPVTAVPQRAPAGAVAYVPASLAGVLRLLDSRNLSYEPAQREFILFRRGYAGFRMYARTIDQVDGLRRELEVTGLPVSTAAEDIQRVKEMDHYLTLIFWLVAAVGIAGSIASLVASLYASVERKKRPLSVLRLLGLSGPMLFRFPIYQGVMMAGGGFLLATGFFHGMAFAINRLFQAHLRPGESFCHLPPRHLAAALVFTLVLAALSALVAVVRLARIEPAEALRDE
ncbi:MAG: ABC transporter permease [Kiritimatiellia bacterium]